MRLEIAATRISTTRISTTGIPTAGVIAEAVTRTGIVGITAAGFIVVEVVVAPILAVVAGKLIVEPHPGGGTGSRCSKIEAQAGQLTDLMATCVDGAGAKYPTEFAGQQIHPLEGHSLKPMLHSSSPTLSFSPSLLLSFFPSLRPLFREHEGNRAVRFGSWKLVAKFPGGWELYDLAADRAEQRDLAAQHPERVREMAAQYDGWAKRVGVLPWPIGSAIKAEAAAKKAAATPK